MIEALIAVPVIAAIGAWFIAIVSGIQAVSMMPAGKRLSGWFQLGGWQFDKVEAVAGPRVAPALRRYRLAFFVFFGAIVCLIAISMLIGTQQESSATTAAASHSLDFRFPDMVRQES